MKTLEDLKRTLRTDICQWCPVYEPDEPCTVETRGPNNAMCNKAKDERAEYIWKVFCDHRLQCQ